MRTAATWPELGFEAIAPAMVSAPKAAAAAAQDQFTDVSACDPSWQVKPNLLYDGCKCRVEIVFCTYLSITKKVSKYIALFDVLLIRLRNRWGPKHALSASKCIST